MLSGLFKDASKGAKLIVIAFVILISLVIFSAIGILLAIPLFHLDIANLESFMDATNPENAAFMKYFQSITSIGLFVVPPLLIAVLLSNNPVQYLSLNGKSEWLTYIITVTVVVFAMPFINYIGQWNEQLSLPESLSGLEELMKESEAKAQKITELFLQADTLGVLMVNIFVIAFLPAVGEELLFRGVFQKWFTALTHNKHLGVWLAAILFSAVHFQFYGFFPRILLGALFGYLLLWTGNIWLSVTGHFFNNAFAVIAYYMMNKSLIASNPDEIGTGETGLYQALLSLLFVGILLFVIYKSEKDNARRYFI